MRACELGDVEDHHVMEYWAQTDPVHDGSQAFGDNMIDANLVLARA